MTNRFINIPLFAVFGRAVPTYLFILLGLLLILACQKPDLSQVTNQNDGQVAIIGHGGLGFPSPNVNLPANSWESITKAVENYQADGVEVDVQMSADGTLYLYHDARLQSQTDCLGCLYQWEDDYLSNCQYASGFTIQQNDRRELVQLQTILERFGRLDPKPKIFLDLKTSLDCPQSFEYRDFESQFIASLLSLVAELDDLTWIIFESADLNVLRSLKINNKDLRLNYFSVINESAVQTALAEDFFGLSANFDQIDEVALKAAREAGISITLGIQQTRSDALQMIEYGPDFIYTDNIPLLQSILN